MKWKYIRSLYNNHILIYPHLYVSSDDIIEINNVIYDVTGISDDGDVYLKDGKKNWIYPAPAFVQKLETSNFKYIKNLHNETIQKNKFYSI